MRIRLKTQFFMDGHLYQPGEIVTLPDGVKGPHRMRVSSNDRTDPSQPPPHDRIDYGTDPAVDANRLLPGVEEEPLFDVVTDESLQQAERRRDLLALHAKEREDMAKRHAAELAGVVAENPAAEPAVEHGRSIADEGWASQHAQDAGAPASRTGA
jgi:hypothetical protein